MAIVHQLSKEPRVGTILGRLKNGLAHIGSSVAPWSTASRELAAGWIATRKVPPILINTMPKSGSIYLTRTVATSLEIEYSLDSLAEGEFAIMSLRLPSHTNRWRHNCVRLGI